MQSNEQQTFRQTHRQIQFWWWHLIEFCLPLSYMDCLISQRQSLGHRHSNLKLELDSTAKHSHQFSATKPIEIYSMPLKESFLVFMRIMELKELTSQFYRLWALSKHTQARQSLQERQGASYNPWAVRMNNISTILWANPPLEIIIPRVQILFSCSRFLSWITEKLKMFGVTQAIKLKFRDETFSINLRSKVHRLR